MEETGLDINQPAKSFHRIPHRRSRSIQGSTSFSGCIGHFHARFSNGVVSKDDLQTFWTTYKECRLGYTYIVE